MILISGNQSPVAHYSKMKLDECDSDEPSEGVAFMDTPSSPSMPKASSEDPSSVTPQCMNALYYLFVLTMFTFSGMFVAFLFYEIL